MYKAYSAVDRVRETCTRTYEIGPGSPHKTVWWKVDLGGVFNIYNINIQFKNYDGHGLYTMFLLQMCITLLLGKNIIQFTIDMIKLNYLYILMS